MANLHIRKLIIDLYIQFHQWNDALLECENLVDYHPEREEVYHLLGRIYRNCGETEIVQRILENAISQNIFLPCVINSLVQIYVSQGQSENGVRLFKTLVEQFPDSLHYKTELSVLYAKNQQYTEASDIIFSLAESYPERSADYGNELALLLKNCPDNNVIRHRLIQLYIRSCHPIEALPLIQDMINVDSGAIDQAIADLRLSLELYPDIDEVKIALASTLPHQQEYTEAVTLLSDVFDHNKSLNDQIKKILNQISALCPQQFVARILSCDIALFENDFDEA